MADPRASVLRARRVVVKIGSRALASDAALPARLAQQIADARMVPGPAGSPAATSPGRLFVVVSSGAIAIGCGRLGYRGRPREMARLQAAAAAGQSVLMRRYDEAFGALGMTAAQVLLTHADLADRERVNNAREALAALLDAGAVPIINENDTVSTDEIRFGDNDQLAALVTPLVGADLLVLLTDVEGVLDDAGRRIPVFADGATLAERQSKGERVGSGGMGSKVDAARKGAQAGAAVVIAPAARPDVLAAVLSGADVGTLFEPRRALKARQHWIAFTLRPRGTLLVDDGAGRALRGGRSSLLPVGVVGVRGRFEAGDPVTIATADGREVARGLARVGVGDCARAAGLKGAELEAAFGPAGRDLVLVHRDDLVVV